VGSTHPTTFFHHRPFHFFYSGKPWFGLSLFLGSSRTKSSTNKDSNPYYHFTCIKDMVEIVVQFEEEETITFATVYYY
jgi:hypothetical protein